MGQSLSHVPGTGGARGEHERRKAVNAARPLDTFCSLSRARGRVSAATVTPYSVTDFMPTVLADYRSMCELVGPLDFETFCAGYACYEEWAVAREHTSGAPAVELPRRDQRARASYAA